MNPGFQREIERGISHNSGLNMYVTLDRVPSVGLHSNGGIPQE